MAEGIREGKPVSPDFDVAAKRHQLLDAIQKASDTGMSVKLSAFSNPFLSLDLLLLNSVPGESVPMRGP